ncbi:MAG: putative oxidoreductase [Marmoricola sp.]|jgi:NADPH2:quinone reductase|nr:putative oxidoreductase [Marmoricola sp.]
MTTIVVAADFGGPEVLSVREIDLPEPGPGQVRIAVRAAGVNPVDVKSYGGSRGTDPSRLPLPLGMEAAGVITAVGPGVERSIGEEVVVFRTSGAYASDLVTAADTALPKPAGLDWAAAGGLLLTGATAVHALTATNVSDGETVLVHGGAGGVGLMAIQLAALRGAQVVATASPAKHALLREFGAIPVAYGAGLLDRVREAAPQGIDAALDLIGTDEAMETSLALVSDPGRVATIANYGPLPKDGVKRLGGGPGADPGTELRNAARAELIDLAGTGRLRVLIDRTYPLAEAADAHRQIIDGHVTGKLVLIP